MPKKAPTKAVKTSKIPTAKKVEPIKVKPATSANSGSEPTDEQIDEVLNQCMEQFDKGGSRWAGMTYEQGVKAAIDWMLGEGDNPMEDN